MVRLHSSCELIDENGYYKKIQDLQPGDFIMNANLVPIQIRDIRSLPNSYECQEIRHENWYIPFYCDKETNLCTTISNTTPQSFQFNTISFKTASMVSKDDSLGSIINIYREMFEDKPNIVYGYDEVKSVGISYDLGVWLGLYLGFGNFSRESNREIIFRFGPNQSICDRLKKLTYTLFSAENTNLKVHILESNDIFTVHILCDDIYELVTRLGTGITKSLPRPFLVRNTNYMLGLIDGLTDFDNQNQFMQFFPVNREIAKLISIACSFTGIRFSNQSSVLTNSFLIHVNPNDQPPDDTFIGKVIESNSKTMDNFIELEFNDSDLIIVNNIIIKT